MDNRTAGNERFFIRKPRSREQKVPLSGGGSEPKFIREDYSEEDNQRRNLDVHAQISSTISEISNKPLHDNKKIFFTINLGIELKHPNVRKALDAISAQILAYLNVQQTHLLVSANPSELSESRSNKLMNDTLRIIRPLRLDEQILLSDTKIKQYDEKNLFLIHIMPNLSKNERTSYIDKIIRYLQRNNIMLRGKTFVEQGIIPVFASNYQIKKLIDDSNFIFSAELAPRGVPGAIEMANPYDQRIRSSKKDPDSVKAGLSSMTTGSLPTVIVVDTGLNNVLQLKGLIIDRDKDEDFFDSPDDNMRGHGTPISYLVALGENNQIPRARIISYKVWSKTTSNAAHLGILKALEKYGGKAKVFVSSVNFLDDREKESLKIYHEIDRKVQELNVVMIYSAGNIKDGLLDNISKYPKYLPQYPVQHPARGISITAVGGITKFPSSKFREGMPCPFTRCGFGDSPLFECIKPEVVEHGGNLDSNLQCSNKSVSSIDATGHVQSTFCGTSFSAPIFAGRIAEIKNKYKEIKNSETLKAISLISCSEMRHSCCGLGEPQQFLGCNQHNALWVFEGSIQLPENLDQQDSDSVRFKRVFWDELYVEVPYNVRKMRMCIVHSDDYFRFQFPTLRTYIRVRAKKLSNNTKQEPDDRNALRKKSHVKILSWSYRTRSMGGSWSFDIIPEYAIYIPPLDRKNVIIRYGCAILMQAKESSFNGSTVSRACESMLKRFV